MNAPIFYLLLAIILGAGYALAISDRSRPAALWLLGTTTAVAALAVAMHQRAIALAVIGLLGLGGGGVLHLVNGRMDPRATSLPVSERARYWSGLVAVLLFVLILRVVSASDWGTLAVRP